MARKPFDDCTPEEQSERLKEAKKILDTAGEEAMTHQDDFIKSQRKKRIQSGGGWRA